MNANIVYLPPWLPDDGKIGRKNCRNGFEILYIIWTIKHFLFDNAIAKKKSLIDIPLFLYIKSEERKEIGKGLL